MWLRKGGNMLKSIIWFCLMTFIAYLVVEQFVENNLLSKVNKYVKEKNEKYYDELIKYYEKNKKIKLKNNFNIIRNINIKLDKAGFKSGILVNPIMVIIISIITFLITYSISFQFFEIISLSIIVAIPSLFIPMSIINYIAEYRIKKIEKVFPNFLLQLKNYTKISNDIIFAFEQVETIEPLQKQIDTFLIEVNSGIKFEKAVENMKEKIKIEVFKNFLTNVEHCYLYGGNFTELISKSYQTIVEIQTEKNNRIEETKSARLVLFILIFLDFFIYITNIKSNRENYLIMQESIIGNLILYWNFISIWLLLFLANRVKKLDY